MLPSTPSIIFKVNSVAKHGSADVVMVSLFDNDNDQWAMLQARKYDVTKAEIKEGDVVRLRIVPEFEDTIPDDTCTVKVRAKVSSFLNSKGQFPEPPESEWTWVFFVDWLPWMINTKFMIHSKVAKQMGIKAGDMVRIIISTDFERSSINNQVHTRYLHGP